MSWSIFKQELNAKMQNPNWNDVSDFAKFFTRKYDECMKRGVDIITLNKIKKGNTVMMQSVIESALRAGNASRTESFYNKSVSLLGKGAIAYWTGPDVVLENITPLIPAPLTLGNLWVISNNVTNGGVWPNTPLPLFPSNSTNPFIDSFIFLAEIHLKSISGICTVQATYPPPAPPAPAILPWSGYTVDAANISRLKAQQAAAQPQNNASGGIRRRTPADYRLSDTELAKLEKELADAIEQRTRLQNEAFTNPSDELTAEYELNRQEVAKLNAQIKARESLYAEAEENDNKPKPDEKREIDYIERIVSNAKSDLDLRSGPYNQNARINEMLKAVGLTNSPERRFDWCASAVSKWWREAGVKLPNTRSSGGDAGCWWWKDWAQKNGSLTQTPARGYAVLWGDDEDNVPDHIGIVESVDFKTGMITHISGNVRGVSGRGVYRYVSPIKGVPTWRVLGYIIPKPK